MAEQVLKSEQINSYMQMVMDYDQPFTKREEFLNAYKKALGDNVQLVGFVWFNPKKNKMEVHPFYQYDDNGQIHIMISAAITYLSKPHPFFKKRMQLHQWHKALYLSMKEKHPSIKVHLMGVYHYDNIEIYCEFNIDDYINNELNSSAAHVYTNDLFQAMKNGTFSKTDVRGNRITTIKGINLKAYLRGHVETNPVVKLFEKFNGEFDFNSWLKADCCIRKMLGANWYQAKGTEWPGWFLEFRVDEFIQREHCSNIMLYTGNKNKAEGMLDFDLFFGSLNFYGDLKASDIKKKEAPGNDQANTLEAISKYGRLWYIVYEHETRKDKDFNNEMAIARMRLINPDFKDGDHVSYTSRMKHSVNFKRMHIYELNAVNMHEILSDFNQGHNSGPSMAERVAKFLLNKENMNNSIIYTYEV